ncbi:MAG TPA: flagellar biosynthetic protein FliO [Stellaceae bacterium]|jgi:flagellar protein FliO/FliZ|nr:flagellar biosynthetic protein FliO [Stellaceae bacterium]
MPLETDAYTTLMLTLGAIVLLLWGVLWFVRRLRPGALAGALSGGGGDCVVLRSLALGPRERLLVVRVGTRHLVVGVGAASVSLLCELDGPLQPAGAADGRFGDIIRQVSGRWRADT